MVGTFYRSATPGSASFVEVGDHVRKGQVLCIIEAMKIMNEIESDLDGESPQKSTLPTVSLLNSVNPSSASSR